MICDEIRVMLDCVSWSCFITFLLQPSNKCGGEVLVLCHRMIQFELIWLNWLYPGFWRWYDLSGVMEWSGAGAPLWVFFSVASIVPCLVREYSTVASIVVCHVKEYWTVASILGVKGASNCFPHRGLGSAATRVLRVVPVTANEAVKREG